MWSISVNGTTHTRANELCLQRCIMHSIDTLVAGKRINRNAVTLLNTFLSTSLSVFEVSTSISLSCPGSKRYGVSAIKRYATPSYLTFRYTATSGDCMFKRYAWVYVMLSHVIITAWHTPNDVQIVICTIIRTRCRYHDMPKQCERSHVSNDDT